VCDFICNEAVPFRPYCVGVATRTRNVSEYMLVLALCLVNILRLRYVARTPPLEARSPGRRSNAENAPRRRPVTGQQRAQTPPSVRTVSSYRRMDVSL